jgi:YD repeat-containing protein
MRRAHVPLTPTPDPSPPTTGINHYWTYEEEPLPGIGKAMVNVGNGNTLVQVDDLDIPERGIDLAFRRTYNSQSQHDSSGTDGSTPSVFGNGWTNTFDAHLAYDSTDNIIQVYDIDGARYDYTSNGQGGWTPPAGQYAQLTSDGACGYYWTKKTGAAYYFEAPNQPSSCGTQIPAGLSGRVMAIQGRNINNSLTFTYSWVNGDDTNPENLTQIVVSHSDGQSLTLTFSLLNGTGPDELQSISRPDGATASYEYDSSGDLLEVDRPGDATTSAPTCSSTNTACIPETYTYGAGYLLATANSPRYTVSQRNHGGVAQEGDTVNFAFDASRRATSMTDYGVVNFIPQDGVSPSLPPSQQPLQPSPAPTGLQTWYTETLSGYGSGVTTVSDSDGHSRMWTVDSLWRVTETQEWTGSQWLVSYQTWDGNDNLITFTDERNNVTTFAYDGNGNAIMEAQPQVTTSMGTFQPTAWYQYDQYNNLLYYCDPDWVHQHNGDYPGGSNPCTGSPSGVVHYVWATGSAPEVYGELTDTYTPLGYHHHLSYDSNGMRLSVVGDTITQVDTTQRTPTQSFTYDAYGNLQTYNPGNGTWHLAYDSLNRVLTREDPDGVYSYICYYADGSTHYTETSYQRARDGGSSTCHATPPGIYATVFSYDADGDTLTQTAVHGGTWVSNSAPTLPTTQGITYKFYDADDRLVEVEQPYDATSDTYTNPWITRYLYDLSQNGSVSFNYGGTNYSAHGNLFKTVELLPPGTTYSATRGHLAATPEPSPTPVANTAYQDTKGTAFDALDRPTAKYSFVAPQSTPNPDTVNTETLTYDRAPATLGLLAQDCNALSQCQTFSYDARGSESSVTFSDSTPSRTMAYDPDSRVTSVTSSTFGAQSYTYDADGRLSTSQDPSGGGVTSPALLTHHYYADGKEESLDVSSSALGQSGLFTYSYRPDGRVQTQAINDASVSGIVNPGTAAVSYTYTAAGRLTQRAESGAAANSTPTTFTYDANGNEVTNTTPGAALSSMEYSAENEMLGFTGPTALLGGSATYSYNARGELTHWPTQVPVGSPSPFPVWYADGAQVHQDSYGSVTWDDRMATATGTDSALSGSSGKIFDAAGRMTAWSSYSGSGSSSDEGRSYDAENHTLTSAADYPDSLGNEQYLANTVSWGPNGHPIMVGISSTQRDTLHWDGDVLLFTTNNSGQLDDIKIGAQGDILPRDPKYKGLTFYDRDPSGGAMGCHNATGATYIGPSEAYSRTTTGKIGSVAYAVSPCSTNTRFARVTGTPSMPTSVMWWNSPTSSIGFAPGVGAGGVLGMPRTDGYADGTDSIQGARTYDSNTSTWTTPDAYAGEVDDPATQKSYMWNGNNPAMYADPTGYIVYVGENTVIPPGLVILVPAPIAVPQENHAFVEVIGEHKDSVFEAGPKLQAGQLLPRLKPRADYGSHVSESKKADRGIAASSPVVVPPPGLMTQSQWDAAVRGAFAQLNTELQATSVPYGVINSNTYVAEGFHGLGLSEAQINGILGPHAIGGGMGPRAFLEFILNDANGGGFDYTVVSGGSGAGSNGALGAAGMGAWGGTR